MRERAINLWVGFLIILAALSLLMLSFRVSGLSEQSIGESYNITATFDNVGGLKIRAPVKIAGVRIGQVTEIKLDPTSYRAKVTLAIMRNSVRIPADTSASILTSGLLGANYVQLAPGYETNYLGNDGQIASTHSAIILEELIGQFMFKLAKQ